MPSGAGLKSGGKAVTTAGTALALTANAVTCERVLVSAWKSNTKAVYVGDSTVKAADTVAAIGTRIDAGLTQEFVVDDPAKLMVDAQVSGEGVSWTALTSQ